jgi:hypothetical protein
LERALSNHRWCCCGSAIDCCDMQSCTNFVTPTQINIQYSGVITRTYSTGQTVVLADYTWNVNSNSAFTMRGNTCTGDGPREFGCPTATLDYTWNVYLWVPEINNQTYLDPLPWPCSSCDANMDCNWNQLHCLQRQDTYYGVPRTVNGANVVFGSGCCQGRTVGKSPPILRLICCEICGCARPTILYTPATTLWTTADDYYVIDDQKCCYAGTPPGPIESPGAWIFPHFQISGRCGCPDGSTWDSPPGPYAQPTCETLPVVPGYTAFGIPQCPPPDCTGLPQTVVSQVNMVTYSWQCQVSGFPDPIVINFCNEDVTYTDTCNHTVIVVVA